MAKSQKTANAKVNAAAERTGKALGTLARKYDGLRARHPNPVEEAAVALAKGRTRLEKATKAVAKRTRKIVKLAKTAVDKSQKSVKRARKAVKRATRAKS